MEISGLATPDIQNLAMAMAKNKTQTDIGIAVLSNALDLSKTTGDSFISMMEQSVNPEIGSNIDLKI